MPDYCGIRPKITNGGDFVIHGFKEHSIKNVINLYGIESPGLTCSLSLARKVTNLIFK